MTLSTAHKKRTDSVVSPVRSEGHTLILAGAGLLPRLMACHLGPSRATLVTLSGFADPQTCAQAAADFALGQFGAMVAFAKTRQADKVLAIGGLRRPAASEFTLDAFSIKHLDMAALQQGDDALLRAISHVFEGAGLRFIGPLEVAPDWAVPLGTLTHTSASQVALDSLARGWEVVQALGALDVGQAVVVQQGLVLATEGIDGTDALIARAGSLRRTGPGPVLIKAAKLGQDLRLDVPTFGPETVENLRRNGFAGAFLQAGKTLLVDPAQTVAAGDAAGLFIQGVAP